MATLLITLILCFGVPFIVVFIMMENQQKENNKKMQEESDKRMLLIKKASKLSSTRDKYLPYFEKQSNYDELRKLYNKLEIDINNCACSAITQPRKMNTPMSSGTAAALGYAAGGIVGAYAASESAKEKKQKYDENERDIRSARQDLWSAEFELERTCSRIENIINRNSVIKADWEKQKSKIV